jgi:hypothetical protein
MGCALAFDRSGEARPVDNLAGAAVGHAEELGDLDQRDGSATGNFPSIPRERAKSIQLGTMKVGRLRSGTKARSTDRAADDELASRLPDANIRSLT